LVLYKRMLWGEGGKGSAGPFGPCGVHSLKIFREKPHQKGFIGP
jgi:hypothetical protein